MQFALQWEKPGKLQQTEMTVRQSLYSSNPCPSVFEEKARILQRFEYLDRKRARAEMMKHPLWAAALLVIYALCCAYLLLTIFGEFGVPVLPSLFG